jgi:hypothetical protein
VDEVIAGLDSLTLPEAPFSKRLMPALRGAFVRAGRSIAMRDACVLGLSCELLWSAEGRYPAKLEELAPAFLKELPPDPFTGKPFHYRLRDGGRGYAVYSVGDNLRDDGGANDHREKDDTAWEGGQAPE